MSLFSTGTMALMCVQSIEGSLLCTPRPVSYRYKLSHLVTITQGFEVNLPTGEKAILCKCLSLHFKTQIVVSANHLVITVACGGCKLFSGRLVMFTQLQRKFSQSWYLRLDSHSHYNHCILLNKHNIITLLIQNI